jgi:hypothetical protein
MTVAEPEDRYGRIMPVKDDTYVGQPVVGYVIRMEDGFFAITARDECVKYKSKSEAVEAVEKKWLERK